MPKSATLFREARFLLGVAAYEQLPPDSGFEVAFVGRSNVGKSSALNALTGRRNLARVSKTPGRTQQINIFVLDETRRLADLPGYGYAQVPLAVKRKWGQLIERYLQVRQSLRGVVLLMDSRHPLQAFDQQMLAWCTAAGVNVAVWLTKADKLSRNEAAQTLRQVRQAIEKDFAAAGSSPVSVELLSAHTGQGVEALRECVAVWLHASGS